MRLFFSPLLCCIEASTELMTFYFQNARILSILFFLLFISRKNKKIYVFPQRSWVPLNRTIMWLIMLIIHSKKSHEYCAKWINISTKSIPLNLMSSWIRRSLRATQFLLWGCQITNRHWNTMPVITMNLKMHQENRSCNHSTETLWFGWNWFFTSN